MERESILFCIVYICNRTSVNVEGYNHDGAAVGNTPRLGL